MARFVLIDHSLTGPGGHNYEYALAVLDAADAAGYEPVLATNHAFEIPARFPGTWQLLPLYQYGWDSTHWIGLDGKSRSPFDIDGQVLKRKRRRTGARGFVPSPSITLARFRDILRGRGRRRQIQAFARSCRQLWDSVRPITEDRVFFPSLSEFDLLGLVRFLESEPVTKEVDWHLQFHFDIFTGRTPTYDSQTTALDRFRRQFSEALARVPDHRLHFYSTTDMIANQYNRLQVARFEELSYPISRSICATRAEWRGGPLRVTCPGVIRREKGKHEIKSLVHRLWSDHLASGTIQLFFQGRPKDLSRFLPKEVLAHSAFSETYDSASNGQVIMVRHPLDAENYARLIQHSHVGLFLYDSQRYYARCSGILVEMLAAGVPTIVPAGCWLAEQITEPNCAYLDTLVRSTAAIDAPDVDGTSWRPPAGVAVEPPDEGNVWFGGESEAAIYECSIPHQAVDVAVSFTLDPETTLGYYARVEGEQFDRHGNSIGDRQTSIIGARRSGKPTSSMFHLDERAASLCLTLTNAYAGARLSASSPSITFIRRTKQNPHGFPAGKIGLISATHDQIPGLLCDMAKHYAHYRQSAIEFSRLWDQDHHAIRTIDWLDSNSFSMGSRKTAHAA